MRILGVDPGTVATGYGVVDSRRGRVTLVTAGCIRTRPDQPMSERLGAIHQGLVEAIRATEPDSLAIEAIFHHKNAKSALILGQARGVALLAAAQCGFDAAEYNPMTVKRSVGAHGNADKAALGRMVCMLLGTQVTGPADITDALAIAITHSAHVRTRVALEAL